MAASSVESESSYHFYVKEIIKSKQIALAWAVVVSRIRNSGSIPREISQAQLDRTESVS
ncbi:hypothetical protein WN944_014417 [Citrus x changshan-huyou]|uniref:Uncharacterized protein n=1 Tax=Citrus x changshan-huyou TaxID=2935761 RepID=A0AAP0M6V3_9ROSI